MRIHHSLYGARHYYVVPLVGGGDGSLLSVRQER